MKGLELGKDFLVREISENDFRVSALTEEGREYFEGLSKASEECELGSINFYTPNTEAIRVLIRYENKEEKNNLVLNKARSFWKGLFEEYNNKCGGDLHGGCYPCYMKAYHYKFKS